ncbi:MAG TPA: N-acetylmuramoyl-L-alanine amidase [Wenzhouxiangella sp.]
MDDSWLKDTPWRVRLLPTIEGLESRSLNEINAIVIHATELPTLSKARQFAEEIHYPGSQTGNSGHFYIDQDGSVECWVTPERVAHHVKGYNRPSIGIELVHPGRYPNWLSSEHQSWETPYPDAQIEALIALINQLHVRLPGLHHIAGHDEIDREWVAASDDPTKKVRRKLDPGPTFPWERIYANTPLTPLIPNN